MNITSKICSVVLTVILVAVLMLVAISCDNGNNKDANKNEVLPTLVKVRVIPAYNGHNGDEESDVCLATSGGKVENFHLEITISNPDKNEILSFDYNDNTYTSDLFSNESTPSLIIVENLLSPVEEGEFEVKIDDITYQKKNGTAKILGLKDNVKKVKIQPTFKLTLDYSEANLAEGEEAIKVVDNEFLAIFNLPSPNDMNDTSSNVEGKHVYGHNGYIFDGWYTEKNGMGTKYSSTQNYHLYKDITLYAHYARAIKYSQVEDYLVVTGITEEGKNTTFPIVVPREIGGVTFRKVGYMAFAGALSNKTIVLPETIVEIGDYAFTNCSNLKIDLGSVEKIGASAFANSGKLTLGKNGVFLLGESNLPGTLKEIGDLAFRGCSWDTRALNPYNTSSFRSEFTLMLPASLQKIGNKAFMESGFRAVYFHSDSNLIAENLGESIFEGSKSLTSIYTGYLFNPSGEVISRNGKSGIVDIPLKTFYNCTALSNEMSTMQIRLNEGLQSIGELAFASSGEGMKGLEYLSFPASLMEIGTQAFANAGLTNVRFSENSNLQTLGDWCFESSKFEEITIYNLENYGKAPFWGNTKLKAINILSTILPTYTKTSLAEGGTGLTRKAKYYVKKELLNAYRRDGSSWANDDARDNVCCYDFVVTDSYGTRLCFEPINTEGVLDLSSQYAKITAVFDLDREIRIPESVDWDGKNYTVISVGTYFVHDEITKIKLPDTIKRIERRAFYVCKTLYECVWMDGSKELQKGKNENINLTCVGEDAFNGTAITYFYSNSALEKIDKQAFHNCKNLSLVVLNLGNSLKIMGSAFSQSGLTTLVIGLGVDRIYEASFQNNTALSLVLIRLYSIPQSSDNDYPSKGSSPLAYCNNINHIYLFSDNAYNAPGENQEGAFNYQYAPNGNNNGWDVKKADGFTSPYEMYDGSWEEALDHYNI